MWMGTLTVTGGFKPWLLDASPKPTMPGIEPQDSDLDKPETRRSY